MKRSIVIILTCVNATFCADIDRPQIPSTQTEQQKPQTVEIKFIDPKTKEVLTTGAYPIGIVKEVPFLETHQRFAAGEKEEESALQSSFELSIDKEIFDKLIALDPSKPLSEDLDFSSSAQLIHAIDTLQFKKFETPIFKTNIAMRIATDLSEHSDQYANMIPEILQYKPLLDGYFKNNELSNAIINHIDKKLLPLNLSDLLLPYSAHELPGTQTICLSSDGNYLFESMLSKEANTIVKKEILTGKTAATVEIQIEKDEFVIALASSQKHLAALSSTGHIIIWDQATLQQKYEFSSEVEFAKPFELIPGKRKKFNEEKSSRLAMSDSRYNKYFFSFSPTGDYLIFKIFNGYWKLYIEKIDELRDRSSFSSHPQIISLATGTSHSFDAWPNPSPEERFNPWDMRELLIDQNSNIIYSILVREGGLDRESKISIYNIDNRKQELIDWPKEKDSKAPRFIYQIGNILWLKVPQSRTKSSPTSFNSAFTFDTQTKEIVPKGDITETKILFLSNNALAIAANPNNNFNLIWSIWYKSDKNPRTQDHYLNSIYIDDPNNIESLIDPIKGISIFHKDGVDLRPITKSSNSKTFIFGDCDFRGCKALYLFKKGVDLPFDILFGILCFEKFDDFSTLGQIRAALRPSIDALSQEIKPIIQKYFFEKMKQIIPRAKE